jgi:hypothetical protein
MLKSFHRMLRNSKVEFPARPLIFSTGFWLSLRSKPQYPEKEGDPEGQKSPLRCLFNGPPLAT